MSSENAVPQQKNNRPGHRLQRAREDRGWSVPQTAEKLHVIPRYVRAIEEGNYNQLPGLVFLKGYVRSYARLVNLSEGRLIEDLEQELLVTNDPMLAQPPASTVPVGFDEQGAKSHRIWGGVVVIIVLAVGGYFLWDMSQSKQSEFPAATPPEASDSPGASDNNTGASDNSSVTGMDKPAPMVKSEIIPQASEPIVEAPAKIEETTSSEPEQIEIIPTQKPMENAVVGNAAGEDGEDIELSQSAADTESLDAAASDEGVVADHAGLEGASTSVKAIFTGDCWFDLRDRNNNRTVGLYRAGDVVDFNGNYPLRLVVGAVDAVSISVAGQMLDFSKYHVRNNRVELVLEQ